MKEKWSLRKTIWVAIIAAVSIFAIFIVLKETDSNKVVCETDVMDEGWDVTTSHGESFKDVSMSNLQFAMCNRGDVVEFRNTLPNSAIKNPTLDIYSIHSVVEVYVDDELIYEYGKADYEKGVMIGYGNNYVDLDEDYAGKPIYIRFTVTEDNAFEGLPAIKIQNSTTMIQKTLAEGRIHLVVSTFLIMFGVITMVISLFLLSSEGTFIQTFCIAMFSFTIGCWTMCNYDLITLMIPDLLTKVKMEYISFYGMIIPFSLYFLPKFKKGDSKTLYTLFAGLIIGESVLFVLAIILQQLNVLHYPQLLKPSHIVISLSAIFVVIHEVRGFIKEKKVSKATSYAFALALVLIVLEVMRYNISKYLVGFSSNQYNTTICFAALIIVIALIVDFTDDIKAGLYQQTKQMLLEQMAYEDELTGLGNRRRCEDILRELHEAREDYTIFSVDMNLLKQINDTLGHEMGDVALKECADALRKTFEGEGEITRNGGDEFAIILKTIDGRAIEGLVDKLLDIIKKKNEEGLKFELSMAYGFANSDEIGSDGSYHDVMKIADERMYACKREMKKNRQ